MFHAVADGLGKRGGLARWNCQIVSSRFLPAEFSLPGHCGWTSPSLPLMLQPLLGWSKPLPCCVINHRSSVTRDQLVSLVLHESTHVVANPVQATAENANAVRRKLRWQHLELMGVDRETALPIGVDFNHVVPPLPQSMYEADSPSTRCRSTRPCFEMSNRGPAGMASRSCGRCATLAIASNGWNPSLT